MFNRTYEVAGDLALTPDGRDLLLVSGAAKIAQSVKVRAGIFKGSWRYDRRLGVPYFQDILIGNPSIELVRQRFVELIAGTDGVLSVQKITIRFDQANQKVLVDFVAIGDNSVVVADTLDFVASN